MGRTVRTSEIINTPVLLVYRLLIYTAIIQPHDELMHHIVIRSRRLADTGCASATCVTLTGHNDHDWQPGDDPTGKTRSRLMH